MSQTPPPNMQPKEPTRGRVLPTTYREIIKVEWVRSFGFWERVGILFGGQLVVMIGVATQHKPGAFQPIVMGKVSKTTTPDAHMRQIIENMIVRQDKEMKK